MTRITRTHSAREYANSGMCSGAPVLNLAPHHFTRERLDIMAEQQQGLRLVHVVSGVKRAHLVDSRAAQQQQACLIRPTHAKNKIAGQIIPFFVLDLWDKAPGYALAPCYIAGIFRPLPGSRHFEL